MTDHEAHRVAVIAYTEYPYDMRVRREVEMLLADGYEVDVIANCSVDDASSGILARGRLHLLSIPIKRGGRIRYLYQYSLFLLASTVLLLYLDLRRRFDVVHVHSLPDFQVFCALPLRVRGIPVILDLHEAMPEIFAARFGKGPGSSWYQAAVLFEQLSVRFASCVIAANDGIKNVIVSRGTSARHIRVVYNVGDDPAEHVEIDSLRRELALPSGGMLVHTGGVNAERDLETLIRALALIREGMDLSLVIAGNGEKDYVDSLKRFAGACGVAGHVVFVGRLSLGRAKALMSMSSVGLVTLERNPLTELAWPTRVAEFANLRKPLLVPDLTFIRQVLGDSARYYTPGSARSLATELSQLLASPADAELRAIKAEQICQRFGMTEMRRNLAEVYDTALERFSG